MSSKRLAVISAVGSHNSFNNQTISYVSSYSGAGGSGSTVEQGVSSSGTGGSGSGLRTGGHHQGLQTMRPGANLHGNVNIMLGGAMLSVVITVVCFVCYCCHRNIKKRSNSLYRQQWLETEANMEIYSVEQCYDPPASGGGTSGFFMDSGSSGGAGDYQSMPVVTGAINHNAHLAFSYHHHQLQHYQPLSQHQHQHQQQQQQQQLHYTPYPNGPPPSYDAVVAQDELLACAVSRRKPGSCPGAVVNGQPSPPPEGSTAASGCSMDVPDEEDCKSSCTATTTGALFGRKGESARARYATGRPQTHRRGLTRAGDGGRTTNDSNSDTSDVTEPFWRSIELEEAEREQEAQERQRSGVESNCSCTARPSDGGGVAQVPPIYCRNCGYYVEASAMGDVRGRASSIDLTETPTCRTDRALDWLDAMNNETTLLVDYETTAPPSPARALSVAVAANFVNRSNAMEADGGSDSAVSTHNTTTTVDIDTLTMEMMSSLGSSGTTARRLDTMNNNNSAANETDSCTRQPNANAFGAVAVRQFPAPEQPTGSEAVVRCPTQQLPPSPLELHGENNNVIIGSSTSIMTSGAHARQDANFIAMLEHQPPPADNVTADDNDGDTGQDILHQCCSNVSKLMANQPGGGSGSYPGTGPASGRYWPQAMTGPDHTPTVEDRTNGNSGEWPVGQQCAPEAEGRPSGSSGEPQQPRQPGIRRLLDENGLVRLDMSQIIDNTGLPTYEAALKLESSGYV